MQIDTDSTGGKIGSVSEPHLSLALCRQLTTSVLPGLHCHLPTSLAQCGTLGLSRIGQLPKLIQLLQSWHPKKAAISISSPTFLHDYKIRLFRAGKIGFSYSFASLFVSGLLQNGRRESRGEEHWEWTAPSNPRVAWGRPLLRREVFSGWCIPGDTEAGESRGSLAILSRQISFSQVIAPASTNRVLLGNDPWSGPLASTCTYACTHINTHMHTHPTPPNPLSTSG